MMPLIVGLLVAFGFPFIWTKYSPRPYAKPRFWFHVSGILSIVVLISYISAASA